jgi:hypothetical protein
MGFLTLVCLGLYIPTLLAIFKPIENDQKPQEKQEDSGAEKINFDVDFSSPLSNDSAGENLSPVADKDSNKTAKTKSKPKRKRK